jgi:predicted RNA binding protein YcfA (HicA-like mRNA interferase family)
LRQLNGRQVIPALGRFVFQEISRRGSHAELRRTLADGTRETLTAPMHEELDKGTLPAIFRQAARYISETDLAPYFYSE